MNMQKLSHTKIQVLQVITILLEERYRCKLICMPIVYFQKQRRQRRLNFQWKSHWLCYSSNPEISPHVLRNLKRAAEGFPNVYVIWRRHYYLEGSTNLACLQSYLELKVNIGLAQDFSYHRRNSLMGIQHSEQIYGVNTLSFKWSVYVKKTEWLWVLQFLNKMGWERSWIAHRHQCIV